MKTSSVIPHIYAIAERTRRLAYVGKDEGSSQRMQQHFGGFDASSGEMVRQLGANWMNLEYWVLEIDPLDIEKAELVWMVKCEKAFDLILFNKLRSTWEEKKFNSDRGPFYTRLYGPPLAGPWFPDWLPEMSLIGTRYFRATHRKARDPLKETLSKLRGIDLIEEIHRLRREREARYSKYPTEQSRNPEYSDPTDFYRTVEETKRG